VKKIKVLKRW